MAAAPRTGGNPRSPVGPAPAPPVRAARAATKRTAAAEAATTRSAPATSRSAPVTAPASSASGATTSGSSQSKRTGNPPAAHTPALDAARDVRASQVQMAFALGWQVAQMYHDYFGEGGQAGPDSKAKERLPGLSELTLAERRRLLARQIAALTATLLSERSRDDSPDANDKPAARDPGPTGDVAVGTARLPSVGLLQSLLAQDEPSSPAERVRRAEEVDQAVWKLHIELLEALTVRNFRLGKSYGLGRALAETVMYPPTITDRKARTRAYADLFDPHRLDTLAAWLQQLKGDFPPHASYTVKASLERWQGWVSGTSQVVGLSVEPAEQALMDALHDVDRMIRATGPDSPQVEAARRSVTSAEEALEKAKARLAAVVGDDLFDPSVPRALKSQGDLWRGMLSGELAPTDVLDAAGYVAGSEAMLSRVRHMAAIFLKQYRWIVLGGLAALAVVVVALAVLPTYDTTNKVVTEIVAVLAALGLSVKGVTSTLGRAISNAEAPLWESEIDESCAVAATKLPGAAPRHPSGRARPRL